WSDITPSDRAQYPEAQTEHASPCHHRWYSFTRQGAVCQSLTGHALRCGCSAKLRMCDTSSKNVSSVGGAYTTLPAADTALADGRGHGAGGGHFGEQEPRGAVTSITTHRDRLVRGTHTTFPTPDRTAPRERLYRAWRSLFGHVRCRAAVTGVTTHGHR